MIYCAGVRRSQREFFVTAQGKRLTTLGATVQHLVGAAWSRD